MILNIPLNKIHKSPQQLNFTNSNIITLIGKNGCGKSSILEKVFESYLNDETKKVVCFSSGQNESFSPIYKNFLKRRRKDLIRESFNAGIDKVIPSFYFDISWQKMLIFIATGIKPNGYTRQFLKENNYITIDEDNDDLSTILDFNLRVTGAYTKRIQNILKNESTDPLYNSIRKTVPHQYLERLIENVYDEEYNFEEAIPKQQFSLNAYKVNEALDNNVDKIFTFLWYVTHNGEFINLDDCKIKFEYLNEADDGSIYLELNDLSDGEYMLLSFYALIDLFDSNDTLFILDEIDSHLYFENVVKLWVSLKKTNGKVITSTHSADSIIQNDFNHIYVVEKGEINQRSVANTIINRLTSLTIGGTYKFRIAAKVKYIALVENSFDWYVFIELCKRKIPNCDLDKLRKIHYVKCSSGYNRATQEFGFEKARWAKDIIEVIGKQNLETEQIFMICDRDELPIADINEYDGVRVTGKEYSTIQLGRNDRYRAYLLSWKRREIENYLICHSLLTQKGILDDFNDLIAPVNRPTENDPCGYMVL